MNISKKTVVSEYCCILDVIAINSLQKAIAIITDDKVTEIFCIVNNLYKKNDIQTEKVHINNNIKHDHRRETCIRQTWR